MINLAKTKVPSLAKLQEKAIFRSNLARNSTRRGFSGPKFHGEYESDKKNGHFNFHQLSPTILSSKMTKNAETAKIRPNKAGHMETMAKNFIFEVKTVAKWLQKPKNRRAIFAGRGS